MTSVTWASDYHRVSVSLYHYGSKPAMNRAINKFLKEIGLPVTADRSSRIACAPHAINCSLDDEPGWDAHKIYFCDGYTDDLTIVHECNHLSRSILQGLTGKHKPRGARITPPAHASRGRKRDLWLEEMECYLQGHLVEVIYKWRAAGFPNVKTPGEAAKAGLPRENFIVLFDPFRNDYVR